MGLIWFQEYCSIEGCKRKVLCKQKCPVHYRREYLHGSPHFNLYGIKRTHCNIRGCAELRTKYSPKCRDHRNQYMRDYVLKRKAKGK